MIAKNLEELKIMVKGLGYAIINEKEAYFTFYNRKTDVLLYAQRGDFCGMNLSTIHKPNHFSGIGYSFSRNVTSISRERIFDLEEYAKCMFDRGDAKRWALKDYIKFYGYDGGNDEL